VFLSEFFVVIEVMFFIASSKQIASR